MKVNFKLSVDFFKKQLLFPLSLGFLNLMYVIYSIKKNVKDYNFERSMIIAVILLLVITRVFYWIWKKIVKKHYSLSSIAQANINRIEDVKSDFSEPKKFIDKSFSKQELLLNDIKNNIKEILTHIEHTEKEIEESSKTVIESESKIETGKLIMTRLEKAIEIIKQATKDMDTTLKIINEISIKSSVISEIVAKTELLAMNASIEAARAGDYGKGFSVVSEEVGDLARNSGKSAKKIRDLLNESSIKVAQVLRLTDERIKDGEHISKMVITIFENILNGINGLKEQNAIILQAISMHKESIKKLDSFILSIEENIKSNRESINVSTVKLGEIQKINSEIYKSLEAIHSCVAGISNATSLREHRNNDLLRSLSEG